MSIMKTAHVAFSVTFKGIVPHFACRLSCQWLNEMIKTLLYVYG